MGGMKAGTLAECEDKQVIFATYAIASEGYDQKGLDTLILASPRSDVIQSVGRILRDKPCDRAHVPLIIDVVDTFSLFMGQATKRQAFYKSCKYTIKSRASDELDNESDADAEEKSSDKDSDSDVVIVKTMKDKKFVMTKSAMDTLFASEI